MATINFRTASPSEDTKPIDLKHAAVHVQRVTLDTPSMTPAATPEEASPAEETSMAGKKIFSMERPDDKARELATKLTLEEQVRSFRLLQKESGVLWRRFSSVEIKTSTRSDVLASTGPFSPGRSPQAAALDLLPSEKPSKLAVLEIGLSSQNAMPIPTRLEVHLTIFNISERHGSVMIYWTDLCRFHCLPERISGGL
jgi:hypothetical protein